MSLVWPPQEEGSGRIREFATAAYARDAARAGRGTVLVVSGEPGTGKSWFARAVTEAAAHEGFRVGWGSGTSMISDPPVLWPWVEALTELHGEPLTGTALEAALRGDGLPRELAVVDQLRQRTADTPALLVVDDAHAADLASLQLIRFVARHTRGLRLVLLVAHRTPPPEGPVADLLDETARAGEPVVLGGLGRADIAGVLSAAGVDPLPDADLAFLEEATHGRPLELQRALAGRDPVATLVDARVRRLSHPARRLGACAALLDPSARLTDLVSVCELADGDVTAARVELAEAGLAHQQPGRGVALAHDAVRAALSESLSEAERLALHARAAWHFGVAPGSSVERLALRARHALAASTRSREDAELAVTAAWEAADALTEVHDHARAASLLADTREVHETCSLDPPSAALLAATGTALLRTGHLHRARSAFDESVLAADAEGDQISLAEAALGLGGIWLSELRSPVEHERVLALQQRALGSLPDQERVLRCRLQVRLAAEEAYAAGRPELMEGALEGARALQNPMLLAEALSLYHHTVLGPEHARHRLSVARELLAVATGAGDKLLSLMGLCWLTVDLFLAGGDHAERSLRDLRERSRRQGCRSLEYIAEVIEGMLLVRAGRLDDAETQAAAAFELGVEVGDADALAYYGAQLVVIRWLQGRSVEMLDTVAETAASPTLVPGNHAFTAVYAALAADAGDVDQARAAITRLRAPGLGSIPSTSAWMTTMFSVIEAAHLLDDAETAREAAGLLEPFAELPVMASLAVVCLGSAHRPLGLAALTDGDASTAVTHLEAAVAANERLGNRPLTAVSRADLSRALVARGRMGDRAAATEELARAIREGSAVGLSARVRLWRQQQRELEASDSPQQRSGQEGVIVRQGSSWILRVADREVVVPHRSGMHHLAHLLTRPGRAIPAAELAGATVAASEREQPVLDPRALAEYRRRIAELEDDIAEAEQFADHERASRARTELDALVDEIRRSTDVHGRARHFASSAERARTSVTKALHRALDQIEAADATLGRPLRRSVRTGRMCCYQPGPGAPRRWIEQQR